MMRSVLPQLRGYRHVESFSYVIKLTRPWN